MCMHLATQPKHHMHCMGACDTSALEIIIWKYFIFSVAGIQNSTFCISFPGRPQKPILDSELLFCTQDAAAPGQQTRVDVLVPPQSQAWMAQQPGVVDLQTAMNSMLQAAASALGPPYTQALQASAPGGFCCTMLLYKACFNTESFWVRVVCCLLKREVPCRVHSVESRAFRASLGFQL